MSAQDSTQTLEQRIQALEDLEAIRLLKARYLNACDLKDIEGIRECFPAGDVTIDYGEIGVFDNREGLIQVFNEKGNHDYIADTHHGSNPQITLQDEQHASAFWALSFTQINSRDNTLAQLGGYYEDEYQKIDGQWLISKTRFVVTSSVISQITDGVAQVLFAGRPPAVAR